MALAPGILLTLPAFRRTPKRPFRSRRSSSLGRARRRARSRHPSGKGPPSRYGAPSCRLTAGLARRVRFLVGDWLASVALSSRLRSFSQLRSHREIAHVAQRNIGVKPCAILVFQSLPLSPLQASPSQPCQPRQGHASRRPLSVRQAARIPQSSKSTRRYYKPRIGVPGLLGWRAVPRRATRSARAPIAAAKAAVGVGPAEARRRSVSSRISRPL